MSKETPKERTIRWIKENPERYAQNKENARIRKIEEQNITISDYENRVVETPMIAIKTYCRAFCNEGWSFRSNLGSFCHCDCNKCPLHGFRNGNGAQIKRGKKENNLRSKK